MIFKNYVIFFALLCISPNLLSANQCNFGTAKLKSKESSFITDSVFALNLQLANESFNSESSIQARSKMFDSIFNTSQWNDVFQKKDKFNYFWNWVRFQFWGLLQQQALLKEDQGFRTTNNKALYDSFNLIYKFPIYPYPFEIENYACKANEVNIYPCSQKILKAEVLLSPALACDKSMDTTNLQFSYLLTQSIGGWTILDIKFKGRQLVLDSFNEYDNLLNKYGDERALSYLKILIHKIPLVEPETDSRKNGSLYFYRTYKIKAPAYPITY